MTKRILKIQAKKGRQDLHLVSTSRYRGNVLVSISKCPRYDNSLHLYSYFRLSGELLYVQIQPKQMYGQMKYYIGGETFDGLNDIIEFFKSNALVLSGKGHNVMLIEPVLQETYF